MATLVKPRKKKTVSQHLWAVHWWMAALYSLLFVGGTYMATLERSVSYRGALYDFHKSLGVTAILLLTGRMFILLRKLQGQKPAGRPLAKFDRIRTVALHTLLYVFMLGVPLSGLFFSNSFKSNNVRLFGIPLPDLFPQNSALVDLGRSLHFWLAYTFLAFVALHALDQWKFLRATGRRFWQAARKTRSF